MREDQDSDLHSGSMWASPVVRPDSILRSRARKESKVPVCVGFAETQDVNCAIASTDFAIAVIGAEPLIEQFDDAHLTSFQTECARHVPAAVLPCLNGDSHPCL